MIGLIYKNIQAPKIVRNEQGKELGTIVAGEDRHGNKCFFTETSSPLPKHCLDTFTEAAARFWLWSLDETHGGRRMRGHGA